MLHDNALIKGTLFGNYVRQGKLDEARALLEKLAATSPGLGVDYRMGDLKAMQGKYDEAAAIFAKFDPLNDAKEEYRRIQSFPLIRLQHGDVYAASFYWLGKIAEKEGKRAEAVDKYSKFLDLWENADPGLSEVVDARRRLAALK